MKNIEWYKEELSNSMSPNFMYIFAVASGAKLKGDISCSYKLDCKGFIDWLLEEHQILDETEKRYLRNIIKPFSCQVRGIQKAHVNDNECIIVIYMEHGNIRSFTLPDFKAGAMYTGMKNDKKYTLEELWL